jgi:hypothetical protein
MNVSPIIVPVSLGRDEISKLSINFVDRGCRRTIQWSIERKKSFDAWATAKNLVYLLIWLVELYAKNRNSTWFLGFKEDDSESMIGHDLFRLTKRTGFPNVDWPFFNYYSEEHAAIDRMSRTMSTLSTSTHFRTTAAGRSNPQIKFGETRNNLPRMEKTSRFHYCWHSENQQLAKQNHDRWLLNVKSTT